MKGITDCSRKRTARGDEKGPPPSNATNKKVMERQRKKFGLERGEIEGKMKRICKEKNIKLW